MISLIFVLAAERLQCVLSWAGVGMSDVSPPAQRCVQSVAGSALALGTRDCSDTRLICGSV